MTQESGGDNQPRNANFGPEMRPGWRFTMADLAPAPRSSRTVRALDLWALLLAGLGLATCAGYLVNNFSAFNSTPPITTLRTTQHLFVVGTATTICGLLGYRPFVKAMLRLDKSTDSPTQNTISNKWTLVAAVSLLAGSLILSAGMNQAWRFNHPEQDMRSTLNGFAIDNAKYPLLFTHYEGGSDGELRAYYGTSGSIETVCRDFTDLMESKGNAKVFLNSVANCDTARETPPRPSVEKYTELNGFAVHVNLEANHSRDTGLRDPQGQHLFPNYPYIAIVNIYESS